MLQAMNERSIPDRIMGAIISLVLVPVIVANSGVSIVELREEAKRRGKQKEMEEFEGRIMFDLAAGLVLFLLVLVIVK